jgi:geranylgeranyl transferase type-2 subunit alpha
MAKTPPRPSPSGSALEQDGRNFHAWAYRQFVIRQSGDAVTTEDELVYSGARIASDFSNYSAWHYRTILLHKLYCEEVPTGEGP